MSNYHTPQSIKPLTIGDKQKARTKPILAPEPQLKLFDRPKAKYQNESREQAIDRILGHDCKDKTIGKK